MNNKLISDHIQRLLQINEEMNVATTPEYHRLAAEEALIAEEMSRAEDRLKMEEETPRLKLFQVLTTIGGKYKTKIEMTLLDTNATEAAATVRRILEDDGFEDVDKILLHIKEIEGPFEAGNVLSRYGG